MFCDQTVCSILFEGMIFEGAGEFRFTSKKVFQNDDSMCWALNTK